MRGLFAFAITEQGCWLAILLFAFNRGGVGEVGLVAGLLLLPAAVLAPLVAVASDVFPRHIVLTVGYALIAATSIKARRVAMLADAPIQIVYGLAIAFSILLTFGGPTMAAIIPTAATTADELTAANTATGVVNDAGRFIGPLAGALLAVSTRSWPLRRGARSCSGSVPLMAIGAFSTIGRTRQPSVFRVRGPPRRRPRSPLRLRRADGRSAVRLLVRDRQVRTLTGSIATTSWYRRRRSTSAPPRSPSRSTSSAATTPQRGDAPSPASVQAD